VRLSSWACTSTRRLAAERSPAWPLQDHSATHDPPGLPGTRLTGGTGTARYLDPAVAVDVNGHIHIVMFEGASETIVRYLMLGP